MKLNQKGAASMVLIIVIGILVAGGLGFFIYTGTQEDETDTKNTQVTDDNGDITGSDSSSFAAPEPPYLIKVTVTDTKNKSNNAELTFAYETPEAWHMTSKSSEGKADAIFIDGFNYTRQGTGQYMKIPFSSSAGNDTAVDAYTFSNEQIEQYQNGAVMGGEENCDNGPCTKYTLTEGNETVDIYTDNSSGNVVRLTTVAGAQTTDIRFDFEADVNVEAPSNFQELNIPNNI